MNNSKIIKNSRVFLAVERAHQELSFDIYISISPKMSLTSGSHPLLFQSFIQRLSCQFFVIILSLKVREI